MARSTGSALARSQPKAATRAATSNLSRSARTLASAGRVARSSKCRKRSSLHFSVPSTLVSLDTTRTSTPLNTSPKPRAMVSGRSKDTR